MRPIKFTRFVLFLVHQHKLSGLKATSWLRKLGSPFQNSCLLLCSNWYPMLQTKLLTWCLKWWLLIRKSVLHQPRPSSILTLKVLHCKRSHQMCLQLYLMFQVRIFSMRITNFKTNLEASTVSNLEEACCLENQTSTKTAFTEAKLSVSCPTTCRTSPLWSVLEAAWARPAIWISRAATAEQALGQESTNFLQWAVALWNQSATVQAPTIQMFPTTNMEVEWEA